MMKRKFVLFAAVALALAAVGCSKAKDCNCVPNVELHGMAQRTVTAEDGDCDAIAKQLNNGLPNEVWKCEEKE